MLTHRIYQVCIFALLAMMLPSCVSLPAIPEVVSRHEDTILWKRSQVVGLSITQKSKSDYNHMQFQKGGILLHSAGSFLPGGISVFPVSGWLLKQGRLFESNVDHTYVGDEIYLVSLTKTELTLRDKRGELDHWQVDQE